MLSNDVVETCAELGITVAGHTPLAGWNAHRSDSEARRSATE